MWDAVSIHDPLHVIPKHAPSDFAGRFPLSGSRMCSRPSIANWHSISQPPTGLGGSIPGVPHHERDAQTFRDVLREAFGDHGFGPRKIFLIEPDTNGPRLQGIVDELRYVVGISTQLSIAFYLVYLEIGWRPLSGIPVCRRSIVSTICRVSSDAPYTCRRIGFRE